MNPPCGELVENRPAELQPTSDGYLQPFMKTITKITSIARPRPLLAVQISIGGWACLLLLSLLASSAARTAAAPAGHPNIVFVIVDDLRWDDLGCMGNPVVHTPNIDRVAREGVTFRDAFATTPLCSPSRATVLTGVYTHTHGISDNTDRSPASHELVTYPEYLQKAGYETAFLGKWHMGNDSSPRPGFDSWGCMIGQGTTNDAELNIDGKMTKTKGYVTDVLTKRAVDFIARPRSRPFMLYFSHKALHPEMQQRADGSLSDPNASHFIPAERHKNLYAGAEIPRRPNVNDTLEGKPALQRPIAGLPPLSKATGSSDETILDRWRMLAAVDESMGALFNALEQTGQLDNTLIVFTSDEGYFYGEHGLSVERRLAYEESIRIPLLMRYPRLIKQGTQRQQVVLTVDLAPTFLDVAGAKVPATMQGRSLVPLLKKDGPALHDAFLIEYYTDRVFPRVKDMGYQAVRTPEWKYIHYVDLKGMDELYDLQTDPYEMHNRIGEAEAGPALAQMKSELARQLKKTGGKSRG